MTKRTPRPTRRAPAQALHVPSSEEIAAQCEVRSNRGKAVLVLDRLGRMLVRVSSYWVEVDQAALVKVVRSAVTLTDEQLAEQSQFAIRRMLRKNRRLRAVEP